MFGRESLDITGREVIQSVYVNFVRNCSVFDNSITVTRVILRCDGVSAIGVLFDKSKLLSGVDSC